jgi:hypothetical protein
MLHNMAEKQQDSTAVVLCPHAPAVAAQASLGLLWVKVQGLAAW